MSSSNRQDPTNSLENSPTVNRHGRDDPDHDDPKDVHDPHKRDDPESPGIFERLYPSTWGQKSAYFALFSLFAAFVLFVTRLYPPGYHNPYLLVIGALCAGYPIFGLIMREQGFRARSMLDTVVIKLGSPTTGLYSLVTLGKVENAPRGYRLKKEVKEILFGGFVGSWVKMEDVLPEQDLDLASKKKSRDPDDPSALELDGRFTAVTKTDLHGDVYICDANDLDYDKESSEVDRRTEPPSYLHEAKTGEIIQELRHSLKREEAARDEIDVVENRLEEIRQRIDDEKLPELKQSLTILRELKDDLRGDRRRKQILPEEKSSAVREIDEQVDEELNSND